MARLFQIIKNKTGTSIVELLLVFGLSAILLPAVLTGVVSSREGKAQQGQRERALELLRQTDEAVRSVRGKGWVNFAVNGTYHPVISGSSWSLINGTASVSGFTQKTEISDAYRDDANQIASEPGRIDPSTKKVISTIFWTDPYPSSASSITYLTRYLNNLAYIETTTDEFKKGTLTNVKAQDGEIVLSQTGGYGDWCTPAGPITQFGLAGGTGNPVPFAVSAAQGSGNVIATIAEGANNSGVPLEAVTITDPSYPSGPSITQSGVFNPSPIKTYGIHNEVDYGYLATQKSGTNRQGIIIKLSDYTQVGTLDVGSAVDGQSIYVANNMAYLTTTNNKMYVFDITNRSGPHSSVGQISLAGTGKKVVVIGTNAYVATTSTTAQLQIINVTHPNDMGTPISMNMGNSQGATDVYINQTQLRAYLVTSYASQTQPDFFVVDINPTDQWYKKIVSTFNTYNTSYGNMTPTGVVAVSGARAIIVGTGSTRNYQVIGLTGENDPPAVLTHCGLGMLPDSSYNIYGIATLFTNSKRAYSYIITSDSGKEFKIVEGGPGGGNGSYVPTGTFISQPFGPLISPSGFNRFTANISQPQINNVQIFVSVADSISGACTGDNYTFVGVNSTATPFETNSLANASISGTIPFGNYSPSYKNPGQCFKYKVILNTPDSTLTPVFKDMMINYSP
ncbi:MAG: hypothetical protein Q7S14_03800 [bacterium]|nr:hypothetical protein [bacterium]